MWLFKPAKIWSKHQIDVLHICSMSTFQILYDFLHVQCISNAYINLRWFYNSLQQCVISFKYMHVREYLLLSLWLHWEYIATFPCTFHVQCVMWLLNLREFFSTSKQRKTVCVLIIYSNFRRIYIIDVRLIEKCKWMRQCLILFEEVVVSKVILNKLENDCIFVRGSRLGGGPNPCPPPLENSNLFNSQSFGSAQVVQPL